MFLKLIQSALARPARLLVAASLSAALVACGGGGGSPGSVPGSGTTPGTPGTPVAVASVTVTAVAADGTVLTGLSGTQTATVRAVVKSKAGLPVANAIVKFSLSDPLLVFTPDSASALTDDKGVAVITVKPTSAAAAGALAITATATVENAPVTGSINLAVGPAGVVLDPTLAVTLVDSANAPLGSLSGTQTATVRALVKSKAGLPVANVIVKFTLSDPLLVFIPDSASALTDVNGVAELKVTPSSASSAGAVAIAATTTVENVTARGSFNLSVIAAGAVVEPTLAVTVVDGSNAPLGSLSGTQSGTVRAFVKSKAGLPVANTIVKFTLSDPLLVFIPDSATALTDANGVAELKVKPTSVTSAGAVAIAASVTVENVAARGSVNVSVGPAVAVVEPTLAVTVVNSANAPLGSLSGTQSGTVRVVLKSGTGAVVPNAIVKFTLTDPLLAFTPDSASSLTDANGVAVITVKPASTTVAGAVGIIASAIVNNAPVSATVNIAVGPAGVPANPTMALTVVDNTNAAITSLSGTQSANVRSLIKDSNGAVVPNVIVEYTISSPLLVFTPQSGSALTDASGFAVIAVSPASISSAGAVAISATAVVAGKTASATTNVSVVAAPLTVSSMAFSPAPVGSLPSQSSAALNIGITTGGRPAASAPGLVLTSLCVSDGTATLVAGTFTNGVQTATYVNKGCTRGTDVLTATLGSSSMNTTIAVDAANIGTIQFVSSNPTGQSIVLKGSGGQGRQESALLTFRVLDENNVGLAGVAVTFRPSTATGGLSVAPAAGTTDATGQVTTTVSSGTIPTPVRVLAQASRNGKTISGLSDTLIISTGLPIQKSMSLSVDSYNINGWNVDGAIANVTIRMADQYGNPISDNTAVSFVTEGGAIGSSAQGGCQTINGGCSVTLKSQNFRPANGRVTVLAFVQGIEDFVDVNGDGQYSCSDFTSADGTGVYRPLVDTCNSGGEPFTDLGDPFLDAGVLGSVFGFQNIPRYGALDGSYDFSNGDLPVPYNRTSFVAAGNGKWGLNYIRAQAEITFSDAVPNLIRQVCGAGSCRDWIAADGDQFVVTGLTGPGCQAQSVAFRLYDLHNNPLPSETTVGTADVKKVAVSSVSPNLVASTSVPGGTIHNVLITPSDTCEAGSFGIVLKSPSLQTASTYTYRFTAP
ncbi:beta strand repeat-containing protein [Massilia sp. TWP1-3-3]|uniref:beta strand repeat-containing protein n=1 Tax=Massilia sp. TWP1-3-3 TaxID=2804573 RepID=UPI003CEEB236